MKRSIATYSCTRLAYHFRYSSLVASRYYSSDKLKNLKAKIEAANQKCLDIYNKADLYLEDIRPAREVIPALNNPNDKLVLVSGPPVTWKEMAGAQKGAVAGICMFEGWAKNKDEAYDLCEKGTVRFEANHAHKACGPMAGTITPSFPVYVVRNKGFGNVTYSRPADLAQQFGDYNNIEDIKWWRDSVAPYLGQALRKTGPIPLNALEELALSMGDESHNRNNAVTALFTQSMAIKMLEANIPNDKMINILKWYHWSTWGTGSGVRACLGLVMAMAKACLDPAYGVEYSTLVTCLARNGHRIGMKLADQGDTWFASPAPIPQGMFFGSYKQTDVGRDMGDSAITEANGWGSNVLLGALGYLTMVPDGTVARARLITEENKSLMIGRSKIFHTPAYDFEGIPQGLDVRIVLKKNLMPWINTGITHKEAGHRVIGRGLSRPPRDMFEQSLKAFAKKHNVTMEEVINTVD